MSAKNRGALRNRNRQWPKRAIALFALIVVAIYALIFLTGARQGTPKLGIDLQGGTRVTLVPQARSPLKTSSSKLVTSLNSASTEWAFLVPRL